MPNLLYNGIPVGGTAGGAVLRAAPVFDGSLVTSASAVVGGAVNFAIPLNTLSLNANQVLTYGGYVANNTWTRLRLTETGGADRTITIPSTLSFAQGIAIVTFTLKANSTVEILLCWTGTVFEMWGEYATPGQIGYPFFLEVACSDETTAITAGNGKVTFRTPYPIQLQAVRGSLTTAQTSGGIFTVDLNATGTGSVLSTKLTIDNTERTSVTAAAQPVLSTTSFADDQEWTVDVDSIGDGTAKGLKICLIGIQR